ncbi:MAG: hypothetical protein ACXACU_13340, partial [Candidatus Hodarchaeales archaeon]
NKKTVQVGTIYHHVKLLGDLIDQNNTSKSWSLSERGWFAYNLLSSTQDRDQFLKSGDLDRQSPISFLWNIFAPPSLFFFIKKSLLLFIGWQILFLIGFALITSQAELELVFVFFSDVNPGKDIILSLLSIIISWILYTVIVLIVSILYLRRKKISSEDVVTLTIFMGISLLPLGIFPILVLAQITSLDQRGLPLMIAVLSQLWVIILSARGISVQFFIRMERAGIISLISIYAMVLLGLIIGF